MNIYLLFALAFGAVTGVADVRVSKAPVSVSIRAERRSQSAVRSPQFAVCARSTQLRTSNHAPRTAAALSAVRPRAPAVTC
jgi:ribosomal protein L32